jgi:ABC-type sugar transport system ATPase subunit
MSASKGALLVGIRLENIRKVYGDTIALAGLSLEAHPGEILGIAGPNGAGKSTMVKILASEETQDSGNILLNGKNGNPKDHKRQVAVVHQEPQLFPNLTVAENILVGMEKSKYVRPKGSEVSQQLLEEVGLSEYANRELGDLPLALQQRTEIAHALVRSADVFLFDEPNSALTEGESAELFEWMHKLANNGTIVILVSHRLSELADHCDRVLIINDGEVKTEIRKVELNEERIARELVTAKSKRGDSPRKVDTDNSDLLTVSNWSQRDQVFSSIELSVRSEEILAVIGVEGSGGRELVRSLAGFSESSGQIDIRGLSGKSATNQVAFVSGDRANSLFSNFSVGENLYARLVDGIKTRIRTLSKTHARSIAESATKQFLVRTPSIDTPIRSLSGGNQQKVAIASALALKPQMIALEEPTRGVDISSKREIYKLVREYVEQGNAAVFYCTEVSEVYDSADRVVVISNGKIRKVLDVWNYSDAESLADAITQSEEA